MGPKISIIIVTRNRAAHLKQTLEGFQKLVIPSNLPTEILVVDNASTDSTSEVVRFATPGSFELRYMFEGRTGKSLALNTALAATKGEFLLFTDDDVRVPAGWVVELSDPLRNRTADAVAGSIRLAPHLLRDWMTSNHRKTLAEFRANNGPAQDLVGANMAFTRKVAETLGGFDTGLGPGALGNGEDSLFYLRAKEAGFRIQGLPSVEVEHHFDTSRFGHDFWLRASADRGRSKAYMNCHWSAQPVRTSIWKVWQYYACIAAWRLAHTFTVKREGCHWLEMRHMERYHFHVYTRRFSLANSRGNQQEVTSTMRCV